jgi:hypothetical protein
MISKVDDETFEAANDETLEEARKYVASSRTGT